MNGLVEHESGMEPCELSEELQEVAEQIRTAMRLTVFGVGRLLDAHMHKVPHGSQMWFVEIVCGIGYKTALRARRVYTAFENVADASSADIGASAFYALAKDNVPLEARIKAVAVAREQPVNKKLAAQIISEFSLELMDTCVQFEDQSLSLFTGDDGDDGEEDEAPSEGIEPDQEGPESEAIAAGDAVTEFGQEDDVEDEYDDDNTDEEFADDEGVAFQAGDELGPQEALCALQRAWVFAAAAGVEKKAFGWICEQLGGSCIWAFKLLWQSATGMGRKSICLEVQETKEGRAHFAPGSSPPVVEVDLPAELDQETFRQAWAEWEQHRKEIRKKLTPRSRQLQLKQCVAWGVDAAVEAINSSIAAGYTALVASKRPGAEKRLADDQGMKYTGE